MTMQWYHDIWHNQDMYEVDPFGYGMGLAVGYVLVPAVLLFLMAILAYEAHKKIKGRK